MRIFLNEIRKLFRLPYLLAAAVAFLYLLIYFPGNLSYHSYSKDMYDTESYPDSVRLGNPGSVSLLFSDMLLEKYGTVITADEIPLVRKQYEEFCAAVDTAFKNDAIFQKYGISSYEELRNSSYVDLLGDEYYEDLGDGTVRGIKNDEIVEHFENSYWEGSEILDGTRYPVGFIGKFESLLSDYDTNKIDYPVMDSRITDVLRDTLFYFLFAAFIAQTIIILPYLVRENKSGVIPIQYTAKKGRKLFLTKLLAVGTVSALMLLAAIAALQIVFKDYHIERYYDSSFYLPNHRTLGITPEAFQARYLLGNMTIRDLLLYVPAVFFVFGLSLAILTALISSRLGNIITAFAAAIPVILLSIFFLSRYIWQSIDMYSKRLLFSKEPTLAAVLFAAAVISAVVYQYKKTKSADI